MIITLSFLFNLSDGENLKDHHTTQKKQFVNFINEDGEYARNLVDLTSNEADGFDDLFRGRGSIGGGIDNSLSGLSMDGDNMDGPYNQLGVGGGNAISNAFEENNSDQRTGTGTAIGQALSPSDLFNDGYPYNPPSSSNSFFGSLYANTPGQGDILSPFYNSENKLEDNINLGDSVSNNNPVDLPSFTNVLQSLNHENTDYPSLLKNPGKTKASPSSDVLSNELNEIDSSDEKLQKLLETNIGDDSSTSASATVGSFLSALLSQQGNGFHTQHIGQQQPMQLQEGNAFTPQQMQQSQLNQLSGAMGPNDMPIQTPVTVHVHASDKPMNHNEPNMNLPEESRAVAQQAQNNAMKQHKLKLSKLKKRLALLRQKLTELEEEQSKKSTQKNPDPKETRKDAIKRILIKNLKIAAMIASKEVQLEESKSHELESMSRRKEDEDVTANGIAPHRISFSKPVTELSKKAEDEVNHLTSGIDRTKLNSTLHQKSKLVETMQNSSINEAFLGRNTSTNENTQGDKTLHVQTNSQFTSTSNFTRKSNLMKIDETLQNLDHSETLTSHDDVSSPIFLKKLRTQIKSMSLDKGG